MLATILLLVRQLAGAAFAAVFRIERDGAIAPLAIVPGGVIGGWDPELIVAASLHETMSSAPDTLGLTFAESFEIAQVVVIRLYSGAALMLGWNGPAPDPAILKMIAETSTPSILGGLRTLQTSQSLARHRNRMASLLSNINEGIIVQADTEGPSLVSPLVARWIGLPAGEMATEIVSSRLAPLITAMQFDQTLDWQALDGVHLKVSVRPMLEGGMLWIFNPDPAAGINQQLKVQADNLQRLKAEIDDERRRAANARAEAEEANRTKSEFLSTMSHELRTPLNAIIGFTDLMRSGILGDGLNTRYLAYLDDIHTSGEHLLSLVNDILDMTKIEAGKMEPHIETIEPDQLVANALALVRGVAYSKRVILFDDMPAQLLPMRVDWRMAKQVLVNLLSNAIKFSEPGSRVSIVLTQDRRGTSIQVIDTGLGMAEDDIAVALEPFGQIAAHVSRKQEGTGLGLPITKAIMELHGGLLTIASALGLGTTCSVFFPAGRLTD